MKIPLKIHQINPDRTDYKKWGLILSPENLRLIVDVPDEYCVQVTCGGSDNPAILDGWGIWDITEDGFKWLLNHVAALLNETEEYFLKTEIQKVNKKGGK